MPEYQSDPVTPTSLSPALSTSLPATPAEAPCPICGLNAASVLDPTDEDRRCPACGFEVGYDDGPERSPYALPPDEVRHLWRARWFFSGSRWQRWEIAASADWDPVALLHSAGFTEIVAPTIRLDDYRHLYCPICDHALPPRAQDTGYPPKGVTCLVCGITFGRDDRPPGEAPTRGPAQLEWHVAEERLRREWRERWIAGGMRPATDGPLPPRAHPRFRCRCCGYRTLDEKPPGTFDICPVCFWEDDNVQTNDPDSAGGANRLSLNQSRANFLANGAKEARIENYVRPPWPWEA